MRVGWDLDGCVHGFIERCNWIRRMNKEKEFTRGSWYFYRRVGMDDRAWVKWCDKAADSGHLFGGTMLPGSVEASWRVHDMGHTNVVITDRSFGRVPQISESLTITNLKDNNFSYDEIHFSRDKTLFDVDMMVEDKLENYDALVAAGVDAYLIDEPWNRVSGGDARKRIRNIGEFANMVEQVTDQGYADLTFV